MGGVITGGPLYHLKDMQVAQNTQFHNYTVTKKTLAITLLVMIMSSL